MNRLRAEGKIVMDHRYRYWIQVYVERCRDFWFRFWG